MATKEIRKLVKSLEALGWRVEQLKSGRRKVSSPQHSTSPRSQRFWRAV